MAGKNALYAGLLSLVASLAMGNLPAEVVKKGGAPDKKPAQDPKAAPGKKAVEQQGAADKARIASGANQIKSCVGFMPLKIGKYTLAIDWYRPVCRASSNALASTSAVAAGTLSTNAFLYKSARLSGLPSASAELSVFSNALSGICRSA